MTLRDLNALTRALSRVDYWEIHRMSNARILDNFSILGMPTKQEMIDRVRAHLQAIHVPTHRLQLLAAAYCWLAGPSDVLSPWELYRLDSLNVNLTDFDLHERIGRELGIQGCPEAFVSRAEASRRYACIVVPDIVPTIEHCVICVCVWNSLTYVAVWASESVGREHLRSALATALCGNLENMRIGSFETLSKAYIAARCNEVAKQAKS